MVYTYNGCGKKKRNRGICREMDGCGKNNITVTQIQKDKNPMFPLKTHMWTLACNVCVYVNKHNMGNV